jgi:excisionase family DNA binding protein
MVTETTHDFVTVAEAAHLLDVHQNAVRRKIAEGDIPAVPLGGPGTAIRIPRAGLDTWLWSAGETADAEG